MLKETNQRRITHASWIWRTRSVRRRVKLDLWDPIGHFYFFGGRVSGGRISGGTRAASGWEERPQLDRATHEYSTGWVEEVEEEGGAPTAQDNKPWMHQFDERASSNWETSPHTSKRVKRKGKRGKHTKTCNRKKKHKHVDTPAETVCGNTKHVVVANGNHKVGWRRASPRLHACVSKQSSIGPKQLHRPLSSASWNVSKLERRIVMSLWTPLTVFDVRKNEKSGEKRLCCYCRFTDV